MTNTSVFSHIKRCAEVPSFSTYEERLHPYIESVVRLIPNATLEKIGTNNLAIKIPGKKTDKTVVLTAHLDKIDHFGDLTLETLPFSETETELEGQLDNTVGLGVCLTILEQAAQFDYPNIVVLFSEMEESYGLKHHPERLKGNGRHVTHGQGAEELSRFLIEEDIEPEAIITIDTTPLFKGESGVALYSEWWDYFKLTPTAEQKAVTDKIVSEIQAIHPEIRLANNTNDYLIYGRVYNRNALVPAPSIALEPAIFPYHQANEKVFKKDVLQVLDIVHAYLLGV
ncbi:M28 family peptidase [bacterium]|nr:MAG: M28 family peptidase [bacterium]